jgi:DNA-binding winged helix-turn-helix (wHTH) protein/tetratricopeptide (TPR) repeat protein
MQEIRASAQEPRHLTFSFDRFTLDIDRGVLLKDSQEVPLRPKSFDVLVYLVTHRGQLVSREALLKAVWGDVVVTEDSVAQCLLEIRKTLGTPSKARVRTIHGRGFRFEEPVEVNRMRQPRPVTKPLWRLISRRRPSAVSVAAVFLLALAVAFTWIRIEPVIDSAAGSGALAEAGAAATPGPASKAYRHYLRGYHYHNRRGPGDLERAIGEFEQAIDADPDLAQAHVGLAGSLRVQAWNDGRSLDTISKRYVSLLTRALELDPFNAEAHARIACYFEQRGDMLLMESHWNRAVRYGQENPLVLSMMAGVAYRRFQYEQAIELQRKAVDLDPVSSLNHLNLAGFLYANGQLEQSREQYLQGLDLSPDSKTWVHVRLMRISLLLGEMEQAAGLAMKLPEGSDRDLGLALALNEMGRSAEAAEAIQRLSNRGDVESANQLVRLYAFSGEPDQAFLWLHKASNAVMADGRSIKIKEFARQIRHSPFVRHLYGDKRWIAWTNRLQEFDTIPKHHRLALIQ